MAAAKKRFRPKANARRNTPAPAYQRPPSSALPPLEDGEYYHADVIGLPAVDREGTAIGQITSVENYGAGDLLEVSHDGKRSLIPFRSGIADLEADRVVIDPEFLA